MTFRFLTIRLQQISEKQNQVNHFRRNQQIMANIYYDSDANLENLRDKTISVIGFGSQGHAHALNAKESGHERGGGACVREVIEPRSRGF